MSAHRPGSGRVVMVVARREWRRLLRQPARIVASVLTPLLLWAFLAAGLAESIRPEHAAGGSYGVFLLPGMMTLIAVFAATFTSISLIDDRQHRWLQAALVSPAPRGALAGGKILGGAAVAFSQAAILLVAAPWLGLAAPLTHWLVAAAALLLTCTAMTGVGLFFAWRSPDSAAFHAVMNIVLMPMWLLSGAFTPLDGATPWLGAIMNANPLAWCTRAIRAPLTGDIDAPMLAAAAAFAAVSVLVCWWTMSRPTHEP